MTAPIHLKLNFHNTSSPQMMPVFFKFWSDSKWQIGGHFCLEYWLNIHLSPSRPSRDGWTKFCGTYYSNNIKLIGDATVLNIYIWYEMKEAMIQMAETGDCQLHWPRPVSICFVQLWKIAYIMTFSWITTLHKSVWINI